MKYVFMLGWLDFESGKCLEMDWVCLYSVIIMFFEKKLLVWFTEGSNR